MFLVHALLNKEISYSSYDKNLMEVLSDISSQYSLKISLFCQSELKLAVNFHRRPLKSILDDLQEYYDLHWHMNKNGEIHIKECEHSWKNYIIKNFFEEKLPLELAKIREPEEEQITEGVIVRNFWEQVENMIKFLSGGEYVIDKHNCIVNVRGKCKTHKRLKEYIDNINERKQILVECRIVEIVSDYSKNLNLIEILGSLKMDQGILAAVKDFIGKLSQFGQDIQVNYTSESRIVLLSQHTGNITVSNETITFRKAERTRRYMSTTEEKMYRFRSGLSLSVVPVVLDNNKVLLKVRPCVREHFLENDSSRIKANVREIITTLHVESGKTEVIGGLELSSSTHSKPFWAKIPFIRRFYGNTSQKKSHLVIFIRPTILK